MGKKVTLKGFDQEGNPIEEVVELDGKKVVLSKHEYYPYPKEMRYDGDEYPEWKLRHKQGKKVGFWRWIKYLLRKRRKK